MSVGIFSRMYDVCTRNTYIIIMGLYSTQEFLERFKSFEEKVKQY